MLFNKFLIFIFLIITAQSHAEEVNKNCLPQQDLKEIASHFKQFRNLTQGEFCFDNSQTSKIIAAIAFMKNTPFIENMPPSQDELFSGKFSKNWFQYFKKRISDISIPQNCKKGMGAYVMPMWGNTMYVCPLLLSDEFSPLDLASVFMHEARHIDGFPHITCTSGPRKGFPGACDKKISDGGSYAVSVETYAQLAKYSRNIHPALRAYAMANAIHYSQEAFEIPAKVLRKPQLLLMTKAKELFSLSPHTETLEPLGTTPALGRLIPRSYFLILFPEDKNLKAQYFFSHNVGEPPQSSTEFALKYNAQSPIQRAQFIDAHSASNWGAKIFKKSISFSCNPQSYEEKNIELPPSVLPLGILYPKGYNREDSQQVFITSTGDLMEFGCESYSNAPFIKKSNYLFDRNFVRMHKVDGILYGLSTDGSLYKIVGEKSIPLLNSQSGNIFEIAPREAYEFWDPSQISKPSPINL